MARWWGYRGSACMRAPVGRLHAVCMETQFLLVQRVEVVTVTVCVAGLCSSGRHESCLIAS